MFYNKIIQKKHMIFGALFLIHPNLVVAQTQHETKNGLDSLDTPARPIENGPATKPPVSATNPEIQMGAPVQATGNRPGVRGQPYVFQQPNVAPGEPPKAPVPAAGDLDELAKIAAENTMLKLKLQRAELRKQINAAENGNVANNTSNISGTGNTTKPVMPAPLPTPEQIDRRNLPNVLEIFGVGGELRARVQMPGGTSQVLRRGDSIPGSLFVKQVQSGSVIFSSSEGGRTYTQGMGSAPSLRNATGTPAPTFSGSMATPLTPGSAPR